MEKNRNSFNIDDINSVLLKKRAEKFDIKYKNHATCYAKWLNICS